ncbi:hypothetical protein JQ629_19655 [Bradyrhizobium sp. AUGA SZCCT0222]|uniref:hypothetical protein n=1 Tax=Bradyrhizobium sp. AUGA SZCCT0222 TaxID=2807668 RepID=UPI001BA8A11C|nr:hypothetical protein [Bradyrhizobium sp. AUGA SZCCT0222]MBR1269731.1 hypothetical protein [Bradyrhizobium sp. AUGA SZCCT0222]
MSLAPPNTAYDLELLKTAPARGTDTDHGWCYGLPPGISESQWPLSPYDGFPMQPCFTLKLPAQYRTKGADYVALTMFADQQHDEPREVEAVAEYLASEASDRPADPDLLPFWLYKQNRHRMEFRMKDEIDHNFAAIWLTEAEFAGPLCQPPRLAGNALLHANPPPPWFESGSARAVFDLQIGRYDNVDEIVNKYWYRLFGRVPEIGHHAYGIALAVRDGDPNVGRPPRDKLLHKDELGDYIAPYSKDAERFELERLSGRNHLGGTMFPSQWTPKYSATYLEIEEHFGGFNFGGGNAQLDLETMEFDWACG